MNRTKNHVRAQRAHDALSFYKKTCLGESGMSDGDTITDLLTDIRHLIATTEESCLKTADFDIAVHRSLDHFDAEVNGEE